MNASLPTLSNLSDWEIITKLPAVYSMGTKWNNPLICLPVENLFFGKTSARTFICPFLQKGTEVYLPRHFGRLANSIKGLGCGICRLYCHRLCYPIRPSDPVVPFWDFRLRLKTIFFLNDDDFIDTQRSFLPWNRSHSVS